MDDISLKVIAHIDGGSRGNPGPSGAGVVIQNAADGEIIYEGGIFIGQATNNIAEYSGLVAALRAAKQLNARHVEIVSDSQLLVRQMIGQYRVKNAGIKPLYEQACELVRHFEKCDFRHVKREENIQADALVNMALDERKNVGHAAT